jgi:hypothetical protein
MVCRVTEDVAENSQYAKSLPAGRKLRMTIFVLNLFYTERSRRPPEAEYGKKSVAANDDL